MNHLANTNNNGLSGPKQLLDPVWYPDGHTPKQVEDAKADRERRHQKARQRANNPRPIPSKNRLRARRALAASTVAAFVWLTGGLEDTSAKKVNYPTATNSADRQKVEDDKQEQLDEQRDQQQDAVDSGDPQRIQEEVAEPNNG